VNKFLNNDNISAILLDYSIKLLIAVLIFIIGSKLIKLFVNFVSKNLIKRTIDISLQSFTYSFVKILLYILLFLVIAQTSGIQVNSFIAVLASISFTIGLALQGSLSNLASGIMILFVKPFVVGDFIKTVSTTGLKTDISGNVTEIQLFYTTLNTLDNKKITIPNAFLANVSTINYTTNKIREIDIKIPISVKVKTKDFKDILLKMAEKHKLILKDKPINIILSEFDSNIQIFHIKVWGNSSDYWQIYHDIVESAKYEYDLIEIE
jgi:small conductance mechanosensitive channel